MIDESVYSLPTVSCPINPLGRREMIGERRMIGDVRQADWQNRQASIGSELNLLVDLRGLVGWFSEEQDYRRRLFERPDDLLGIAHPRPYGALIDPYVEASYSEALIDFESERLVFSGVTDEDLSWYHYDGLFNVH